MAIQAAVGCNLAGLNRVCEVIRRRLDLKLDDTAVSREALVTRCLGEVTPVGSCSAPLRKKVETHTLCLLEVAHKEWLLIGRRPMASVAAAVMLSLEACKHPPAASLQDLAERMHFGVT